MIMDAKIHHMGFYHTKLCRATQFCWMLIKLLQLSGLGLINRFYGSVILVSSKAVNRLTDTSINWLKYGFLD